MSRRGAAGEIASTAVEASGNLAGVGLGALFAGAEGAVAGAVVGPSFALVLKQAVAQVGAWISGRQEDRVSEAIRVAASDLEQHISEGGELRKVFASEQSAAEDIAEGVLQTVAFSYEQKKAVYLGHLLASVAVREDISVADAHRLTRLVGQLSYRQLTCLAAIGAGPTEVPSIAAGVVIALNKKRRTEGAADELAELTDSYDLIGNRGSDDEGDTATSPGISPGGKTQTRYLALTLRGRNLFELLRLDSLPATDRREMVDELLGTIETLSPPNPSSGPK